MFPLFQRDELTPTGAVFSDCEKYRYLLWRRWGTGTRFVHISGLNPSTADATLNDPTVRREIDFCKRWGFDGLVKTNAFAFRATDPKVMKAHSSPIGTENDYWIGRAVEICEINVAAWGVHGDHLNRNKEMLGLCRWQCLGVTKGGHPKHPLYLPKTSTLQPLAA